MSRGRVVGRATYVVYVERDVGVPPAMVACRSALQTMR
jgi:hypothetical protein